MLVVHFFFFASPNRGSSAVSDSFSCFWNPFPPIRLPHLALVWKLVSSFIASCYAVFDWYPWEANFLKGNRGTVDLKEGWGTWRSGGMGAYSWDALYEKRINKKNKKVFYFLGWLEGFFPLATFHSDRNYLSYWQRRGFMSLTQHRLYMIQNWFAKEDEPIGIRMAWLSWVSKIFSIWI